MGRRTQSAIGLFFMLLAGTLMGHLGHITLIEDVKLETPVFNVAADSPIYIDGNAQLSSGAYPLINGYYTIALKDISAYDRQMISIMNTDLPFRIYDCELDNKDATGDGIYLKNVKNGIIENNTVVNSRNSIFLDGGCEKITIKDNVLKDSGGGRARLGMGVRILDSSNITILDNTVYNHPYNGIWLTNSDHCNITENTVYDCETAIWLSNNADFCRVIDNVVWWSCNPILLNSSSSCLVQGNNVFDETLNDNNEGGILLWNDANDNFIRNNSMIYCNWYGLYVDSSCTGNEIRWNTFIKNNEGGFSQGSSDNAGNTIGFNFWDEWTTPDVNTDGIVDVPYDLDSILATAPNDPTPTTTPPTDVTYHIVTLVELFTPNGGELINDSLTVTWSEAADTLNHGINYSLYYSQNCGSDWTLIANDLNEITYEWNTTLAPKTTEYLIKVRANCTEDMMTEDISDDVFTMQADIVSNLILLYPNRESYVDGVVDIIWEEASDSWGHSITYDVYYTDDSKATWYLLGSDLSGTSLEWDTTSLPEGDEYAVKVVAECSHGVTFEDSSEWLFAANKHVLTQPTVLYPNGGEVVNRSITIEWDVAIDTHGYDVTYDVSYSPDAGGSWFPLATFLTDTSYAWDTVDVTKGSSFLVKVEAASYEGGLFTEDTSDDVFLLQPKMLSLPTILNPVGGETYNDSITIMWETSQDSWGDPVLYTLFFSMDGINWIELTSDYNDTSFEWDISGLRDGSDYVVRVIAASEGLTTQ
ncbi:MAG: right-handed parallel beta-helix repeat-containing protein, partial [Candidatus Thorarchaeota archaeon]